MFPRKLVQIVCEELPGKREVKRAERELHDRWRVQRGAELQPVVQKVRARVAQLQLLILRPAACVRVLKRVGPRDLVPLRDIVQNAAHPLNSLIHWYEISVLSTISKIIHSRLGVRLRPGNCYFFHTLFLRGRYFDRCLAVPVDLIALHVLVLLLSDLESLIALVLDGKNYRSQNASDKVCK